MKLFIKKYFIFIIGAALTMLFFTSAILVYKQADTARFIATQQYRPINQVSNTFSDIAYCETDNKHQTLDLMIPKSSLRDTNPLLIYIHGGGWREGDKENSITHEYALQLANSGLAAATIDYRLSSEATYPAQNNDVACAVRFLVNNATTYKIDPSKMILIGDSAGGQLAAMEAISRNHEYLGVIMAYGVSDLNEQITQKEDTNAVAYLGSKATELAKSDSPAFAQSYPNTSFLLIHGAADSVVPVQESKDFAKILKQHGVKVEFVNVPNAQHAFLGSGDASDALARKVMFDFIYTLLEKQNN